MSGYISPGQYDSINHMLAERRMAARSAGTDDVHVLEIARQRRAEAMQEWLASSARGYRRGRAILTALAPLLCSIGRGRHIRRPACHGWRGGAGQRAELNRAWHALEPLRIEPVLVTTFGSGAALCADDALWFHKEKTAMTAAREHCQWVAMMRQWMMQLDDNRTVELAGKPAAELEVLAACDDVSGAGLADRI